MRNLKKFLALVLAMMMALSLMVTANATSTGTQYGDNASVTPAFEEAVDVLTGMGVFSGDNGDFRPASNVTRAEVAALIYRLATGDVTDAQAGLYAEYGNFSDVRADAWYAGYVGYCANAGYIKGRPGNVYDPTGNVTGYEALAMILRVIGYDKNGEFTGPTWQTEVSAMSQRLGILTNIKTTSYGNTLHLASRRDVVAELLFQADAYVAMVNYTPAFGYQPYGDANVNTNTGNLTGGRVNQTLGLKIFGLWNNLDHTKNTIGAMVGNQETGESGTRLGYAGSTTALVDGGTVHNYIGGSVAWSKYTYAGDYLIADAGGNGTPKTVALGNNLMFDITTGVDLVGHEIDIWYNINNRGSKGYQTYAYFDKATLAKVVKVSQDSTNSKTDTQITNMTATGINANALTSFNSLYDAMNAAGFSVSANTNAYLNDSFGRFSLGRRSSFDATAAALYTLGTNTAAGANVNLEGTGAANGAVNTKDARDTSPVAEASPEYLYMVVSNSTNKAPDAVISLNLQTAQVTGVDNVNAIKTVTVPFVKAATTAGGMGVIGGNVTGNTADWPFITADNVLTASAQGLYNNADIDGGTLEQGQLVGTSAKTRDQKEVGLHITGTRPFTPTRTAAYQSNVTNSIANLDRDWFKLDPVTEVKDGIVAAYNSTTVTLSDGTVLEKSIVYDTVVPGSVPQVANDRYEYTGYRFYITEGNKFIGAERQFGTTFVYGTYMDYDTKTSSSTFNYYLTGVTLDGEKTTVPVKTLATSNLTAGAAINATNALGIPFRDTSFQGAAGQFVNGLGVGVYRGFAYGSDTANWTFQALDNIGVVAGANGTTTANGIATDAANLVGPASNTNEPEVVFDGDSTAAGNDPIIINSTAVNLGAAYAGTLDIDGSTSPTNPDLLYFTGSTKFILVSGFGEDSLEAEVFDGIEELLGDSTRVTIDLTKIVDNQTVQTAINPVRLAGITNNTKLSDMTYLTQEPFLYAQNQVLSRQAKVVILPAVAVTRTGSSALRYVGNATPTNVNSNPVIGNEATQFTMYNNGVAESIWVQGLVNDADAVGSRNNATIVAFGNTASGAGVRNHDRFYNLVDTGRKANDGQPIYSVTVANELWTQNTYVASTYSAQTGSFTTTFAVTDSTGTVTNAGTTRMRNVLNATITNLNKDNPAPVWPGITDLTTLNEAGSMGIYQANQYGGRQLLYVSAITGGNQTVTQVYVCYSQPTP